MFDATIEILKKYNKIGVLGMSKNPSKPANSVPMYMQSSGYEVIPINPTADEIEGKKSYPNIAETEEEFEILNVFRPSDEAEDIVRQAIKRKEDKGDIKAVWLQLGIFSDEARRLAQENDLEYIENACMLIEHGRM